MLTDEKLASLYRETVADFLPTPEMNSKADAGLREALKQHPVLHVAPLKKPRKSPSRTRGLTVHQGGGKKEDYWHKVLEPYADRIYFEEPVQEEKKKRKPTA